MIITKSPILCSKLRLYSYSPVILQLNINRLQCLHDFLDVNFLISSRRIGSTTEKVTSKISSAVDFPERKATVFTCGTLYDKWKKERTTIFEVPKSGVYADINYIDTIDHFEKTGATPTKTVMCIHGIPGNYGVFSYIIKDLTEEGIRVIVPTFPDSLYLRGVHKKKELFRHTVEEKTQVFKDFLKALNVSKLDAIIAHSSAIYPALRLCLDPEMEICSQVFFNTGGHKITVTMRPYWIVWSCSMLYLTSVGRVLVRKTGKFIMRHIMRTPIKDDNFDGIMLLAITMVFSQYRKAEDQFRELAKRQTPTFYCFSEDDKVVERRLTYEVLSLLGASPQNVTYYDKDAQVKTRGKDLPWLKLISFEEGSHYVFRKYPQICNKEIIKLLKKVQPSSQSNEVQQ